MTNFEKIIKYDLEREDPIYPHWEALCSCVDDCEICPIYEKCKDEAKYSTGELEAWLKSEVGGEA